MAGYRDPAVSIIDLSRGKILDIIIDKAGSKNSNHDLTISHKLLNNAISSGEKKYIHDEIFLKFM